MSRRIPTWILTGVLTALLLSACGVDADPTPMTRVPHATLVPTETTVPPTTEATQPSTEPETQPTEEPFDQLELFENVFLPLVDGRLENSGRAIKAQLEENGYLFSDQVTGFIISVPSELSCFISGEPRLWDDEDCVEVLRFVMVEGKRQAEVRLDGEPQYFIRNENGNNQNVSLEDMIAYIQNG